VIDGERSEVVVIGGGIAGLAAAWRLRDRDVLLLEAGDRLGGRVRSDPRGDYWMNYGAHLFPGPGTYVDALVRDCGLETVPVTGGMTGLAVGSTVLQGGRVESYPLRLPLSARERLAFARAGVRIRRTRGSPRPPSSPSCRRAAASGSSRSSGAARGRSSRATSSGAPGGCPPPSGPRSAPGPARAARSPRSSPRATS